MVSVIIPVFNKQDTIYNCINSVIKQTFDNFEIIIIDDGSYDDSCKIIKKIKDPRIKYFYQSNLGVAAARNSGLLQSTGEYISFLDADDEWTPFFLEKMTKALRDADICYCGHYIKKNKKLHDTNFKFCDTALLELYIYNRCTPNTNSWIIRKELIMKNNIVFLKNRAWGEDMLFFINVILHANKISYVPEKLTIYNNEVENSLSINKINKINDDLDWMHLAITLIENNCIDKVQRKKCTKAFISYRIPATIIYRIYNNLFLVEKKEIVNYFKFNKKYIEKMKLCNGIRSIKLYIYYVRVYTFYLKYKFMNRED